VGELLLTGTRADIARRVGPPALIYTYIGLRCIVTCCPAGQTHRQQL